VLSVVRPISWIINSYLQAKKNTRVLMFLGLQKIALLMGFMFGLGQISDTWACIGVGIAFGFHTFASMWVVRSEDGVSMWKMTAQMLRPLLACVPMVAAVLAVRHLAGIESLPIRLTAEILAGAAAYVPSALILARPIAKDFLGLIRKSFGGARGK
jgi:PST family polysaccharide transporter